MTDALDLTRRAVDFLRRRRTDYLAVFKLDNPASVRVLEDLAVFCRANETCFHSDPRLHAVAEGRREVWLRIQQHLNLTSEQLYKLYGGQ